MLEVDMHTWRETDSMRQDVAARLVCVTECTLAVHLCPPCASGCIKSSASAPTGVVEEVAGSAWMCKFNRTRYPFVMQGAGDVRGSGGYFRNWATA